MVISHCVICALVISIMAVSEIFQLSSRVEQRLAAIQKEIQSQKNAPTQHIDMDTLSTELKQAC